MWPSGVNSTQRSPRMAEDPTPGGGLSSVRQSIAWTMSASHVNGVLSLGRAEGDLQFHIVVSLDGYAAGPKQSEEGVATISIGSEVVERSTPMKGEPKWERSSSARTSRSTGS